MKIAPTYALRILFAALLILLINMPAFSQCAMCKAVAEESIQDGYGTAMGLNSGIIFLMFIPYILLSILFFSFFRKEIRGFLKSFGNIHAS